MEITISPNLYHYQGLNHQYQHVPISILTISSNMYHHQGLPISLLQWRYSNYIFYFKILSILPTKIVYLLMYYCPCPTVFEGWPSLR
jgi:hypothetical protein